MINSCDLRNRFPFQVAQPTRRPIDLLFNMPTLRRVPIGHTDIATGLEKRAQLIRERYRYTREAMVSDYMDRCARLE